MNSETNDNLQTALVKFKQELSKPDNFIPVMESALAFMTMWNPMLSAILLTLLSTVKIGVNISSREKAERRLSLIINTIEKIIREQQAGKTNYEAALICPELFRSALIIEDEERVKEHLMFIEKLYVCDSYSFDNMAEALRLVSQLSSMEYKLLKLIPYENIFWKDILKINEIKCLFDKQKQQLTAAFLSLIGMNLVVRKLGIRHNGGPELGTINFDDDLEYIRLSDYGRLFLETMRGVGNTV
jgi:hypothetical protein